MPENEKDPPKAGQRDWRDTAERHEVIYCDESSTDGGRHFGIGGLWIPHACEAGLRAEIARVRAAHTWPHEFKWTKASGGKPRPVLHAFVDAFFNADCRFNAIVVDRQNAGLRPGDDDELHFYKQLHWLIRNRIDPRCAYRVILDDRTNREADRLGVLHSVLNNICRRDFACRRDVFREVIPRDSKTDEILQLADVLLGAVCFHMNGLHQRPNASVGKVRLAEHVSRKVYPWGPVLQPHNRSSRKFNIWLWKPGR